MWAAEETWAQAVQAQRQEAVAAVLESPEAPHLVVFPKAQVLTVHHPFRSPRTWQHSPQEQAEGEVVLRVG